MLLSRTLSLPALVVLANALLDHFCMSFTAPDDDSSFHVCFGSIASLLGYPEVSLASMAQVGYCPGVNITPVLLQQMLRSQCNMPSCLLSLERGSYSQAQVNCAAGTNDILTRRFDGRARREHPSVAVCVRLGLPADDGGGRLGGAWVHEDGPRRGAQAWL